MTHSSIEAIRDLVSTHRISANDVTEVEVLTNKGAFGVCNIQEPRTGLEAKFSLRFTAAMALTGRDTSGIEVYTDALTREPALVALRDKVRVVAWPEDRPETQVEISVGPQTFKTATNVGIPAADLVAQWEKLTHKFRALVDPLLGDTNAAQLASLCRNLEQTENLDGFWRLMRGAA